MDVGLTRFWRVARAVLLATAAAFALLWRGIPVTAQSASTTCGTDLRMLVISADGAEPGLPAIRLALDNLGTPYDVYVAADHPGGLTPDRLSNTCHAFYQGVILTTDALAPAGSASSSSTLTPAEFQTLASYESAFNIRQVTWFAHPTTELGFNDPEGPSANPVAAALTASGAETFAYLNSSAAGVSIKSSQIYLATPLDAATTPLFTDAEGHALVAIRVNADGRENLALTFDTTPGSPQALLLPYGIVNWVTRGLFIGERHSYVSPQVDDLFVENSRWNTATACGTDAGATGFTTRLTGADLDAVAAWQSSVRSGALSSDLRLTMSFNGEGASGIHSLDSLVTSAASLQDKFFWVSHGYTRASLAAASYGDASAVISQNNAAAASLGLAAYSPLNFVPSDATGLANPNFLLAARDAGIRYLSGDASTPGQDNPSPNVGRAIEPGLFVIPRRPSNLFFNVTTPDDWVAEYNCRYHDFWGRNLSYAEVLDRESDGLLAHVLQGDLDPWVFHQSNLSAYDGVHSLLTDLLDRTLAKYASYVTLPVVSPTMDVLAARMAERTKLRAAGVTATIQPGVGLVLSSPVDVTVPITGLHLADAESYGGQWISWVALRAGETVIEPLPAPEADSPPAGFHSESSFFMVVPDPVRLTFDEIPFQEANGLTFGGVTFGFTVGSVPSGDAHYNSSAGPGVGTVSNLDNHALEGTAYGELTIDFDQPVTSLRFNVAMDTDVAVSSGVTVQLVGSGPPLTYVLDVAPTLMFSEGLFTYSGEPITRAIVTFDPTSGTCAAGGNPFGRCAGGRFAIDNLQAPAILPPTASAGASQIVPSGVLVTLAGAATDSNAPPQPLSYVWMQTEGAAVTLTDANTLTPRFTAPTLAIGDSARILRFTLTASNSESMTTSDATMVTVTPPIGAPTANAGAPQTVGPGAAVTLSGTATDPNVPARPLTYAWTQTSGPLVTLAGAATATPTFTAPALIPGDPPVTFTFSLTVGNGALAATATTTVTVQVPAAVLTAAPPVYSDGTGNQTTAPFAANAGDLLVAFVSSDAPGQLAQSATVSGAGLSWTLVRRVTVQYGTSEVWFAFTPSALPAATVSATMTYQRPTSLTVVTFSGAGGIGASAGANATTGAPSVSLKTTKAGSLVYGVGNDWDRAVSRTPAAGQTLVHQFLGPTDDSHWVQTLTAGAVSAKGTTVQLKDTAPTNDRWNFVAVEILLRGGQTSAIQPPNVDLDLVSAVSQDAPATLVAAATDPNVPVRPLTYAWTQTAGDLVALTGAATPALSFVAPALMPWEESVTLGFSLTVSNGALVTSATTTVVVAPATGPLTAAPAVYSDGTGDQTTAPFAANAGNLLVAFVSSDAPGPVAQAATVSGAGLSWTLVRRVTVQNGTSEVWSAFTPTALPAATVTAAMLYSRPTSLTVVTFSGAGGIGASAGANATSGGPAVSVKTTRPGSLVYGVGNDWDRAVSRTPAVGQTLVHQFLGPTDDSHWVQTFTAGAVTAAGTTVQLKDTAPTNDRWNFVGVEIRSR